MEKAKKEKDQLKRKEREQELKSIKQAWKEQHDRLVAEEVAAALAKYKEEQAQGGTSTADRPTSSNDPADESSA